MKAPVSGSMTESRERLMKKRDTRPIADACDCIHCSAVPITQRS